MAKFHSLSLAFQKEYPEEFKKIEDEYMVDWFTEDMYDAIFKSGVKYALQVLTDDNKKKYKKFVEDMDFAAVKKQYLPLRVSVITHGDFRPSNLMHRTLQASV